MLEINARVDDAEQDARAVVLVGKALTDGVRRQREHVVDIRRLTRLVRKRPHELGHADTLDAADVGNVKDFVDRNISRDETVGELALHFHAQLLELIQVAIVIQSDEG